MFDYGGRTGYEPISDADRKEFHEQGYLLLRNVLTEDHRAALERGGGPGLRGGEGGRPETARTAPCTCSASWTVDELFGDLLTHPIVFPYMWGLAGWNIYTHHNHLDVTPPAPEPEKPYWGWHQDGYRQNSDPETMDPDVPRPMFSLKVAYVLSDLSETGPRRHQGHPGQPPAELAAPPGRPDRAQPGSGGHRRDHRQPGRRVHLRPAPVALPLHEPVDHHPQDALHRVHLPVDPAAGRAAHRQGRRPGGPTAPRCSASCAARVRTPPTSGASTGTATSTRRSRCARSSGSAAC